ncbi:MAG: type III-B CRISPR module RAMP protein Cmr4 [Prevotellaceae bacterium]|jgi:CRISPR-associated protein Cmr4|nr:type III-B CRISPR module RAMP protein Cmr4 [Prevotellaceae bacterium]
MDTQIYLIKPFTNMHVGSGKENAGIVDNTIQRDVLTHLPIINSTSLKGALREYAKTRKKCSDDDIKYVFGKGNDKKNGKEQEDVGDINYSGNFIFYCANLLSIPARSDKYPFLNATCPLIIGDFLKQTKLLGDVISEKERNVFEKLLSIQTEEKAICFDEAVNGAIVEFYDVKAVLQTISKDSLAILKNWIGNNPVLVNNEVFQKNITEKLPVIARNNLENGQSTNLWYEEIIPRETVFYTFISAPKGNRKIEFDKSVLQIGANASVGYGFSEMYKPEKIKEELQ